MIKTCSGAVVRLLAPFTMVAALLTPMAKADIVINDVRVKVVHDEVLARTQALEAMLRERHAAAAARGEGLAELLSLHAPLADDSIAIAELYDYAAEQGFVAQFDWEGREVSREPKDLNLHIGVAEFARAAALVEAHGPFAAHFAAGEAVIEEAMPPITVGTDGRRLVNAIVKVADGAGDYLVHEIVSVSLGDGSVRRWESGSPPTAIANYRGLCGPASAPCGTCTTCSDATVDLAWPAADPVWEMRIIRPASTRGPYGSAGGGIVLRNVRYKGRLIFETVHMPVLNVEYERNCGPYRDWLWQEHCFRATGTSLANGFLFADSLDAMTICEDLDDGGTFKGVALGVKDGELELHSELSAGWYRYHYSYAFTLDGEFKPRFGFGTTSWTCVCIDRYHHGYWRFELALDGVAEDYNTGLVNSYRKTGHAADAYTLVDAERAGYRTLFPTEANTWRFINPQTQLGLLMTPGAGDNTAANDTYGVLDYAIFTFNRSSSTANEANDDSLDTRIDLAPYFNNEPLGPHEVEGTPRKRTVFWYHAEFDRDVDTFSPDHCGYVGPTFRVEALPAVNAYMLR